MINYRTNYTKYEIFCLVDCLADTKSSMDSKVYKKYRKSNTKTRLRMKKHFGIY